MSLAEIDAIVEECSPDVLSGAISTVFRRLLANILLKPENTSFHVVRKDNVIVRAALQQLPDSVVETLFAALGFKREVNVNSEVVYVFSGDKQKIIDADQIFSRLEEHLERRKAEETLFQIPSLELREDQETNERRKHILQGIQRDALRRKEGETEKEALLSTSVFHPDDFFSVESLLEKSRRTLLNTGRIRNCFFEARHFTLRRMTHGRVFVCKEGCGAEYLEAHWHLFSGKNIIYSYVAHLTPDSSNVVHLGVEHGYQYNSLPGTKYFRKTVHFSAKRVNETSGVLEYLEHPDRPCEVCVYCGVPFSQLFL